MKQFHIITKSGVRRVLILHENMVIGEMTHAATLDDETEVFNGQIDDRINKIVLISLGEVGETEYNYDDLVSNDKNIIINDIKKQMKCCIIDCNEKASINGRKIAILQGPNSAQEYRKIKKMTNKDIISRGVNPKGNFFIISGDIKSLDKKDKSFKLSMYAFVEEKELILS